MAFFCVRVFAMSFGTPSSTVSTGTIFTKLPRRFADAPALFQERERFGREQEARAFHRVRRSLGSFFERGARIDGIGRREHREHLIAARGIGVHHHGFKIQMAGFHRASRAHGAVQRARKTRGNEDAQHLVARDRGFLENVFERLLRRLRRRGNLARDHFRQARIECIEVHGGVDVLGIALVDEQRNDFDIAFFRDIGRQRSHRVGNEPNHGHPSL